MTTPQILHITGLQKAFGPKLVLDELSLLLNRGDRIALVGENGSGKTTLARIIAGIDTEDDGILNFTPGATVGYLPQEATLEGSASVGQYVARITGDLDVLQSKMQSLEARMSVALSDDELESVLAQYGELQAQFERLGGYDLEDRMALVFAGLDISYIGAERLLGTLSGGEKTRVALAALLLRAPDLLVLDEPTNHLDFSGIEWLEAYLADYPNALLMISHDRAFINRVVNQIAELSPVQHNLTLYHGDYDSYLEQREQRYQAELAAYESQRSEMIRLRQLAKQKAFASKRSFESSGDKFYDHFKRGRNDSLISKAVRDAKQRLSTLEDEKLDNPNRQWLIRYSFDPVPLGSAEPLRLTELSKQFGDQVLFEDLTATIRNGERIVLVAPNGTGKSTLLKIIMQELAPDSGQVTITQSAIPGYLDQEAEGFDLSQNVLDAYRNAFPDVPPSERDLLATLHRCGLFTDGLLQDKAVGDLSMGQRRKLGIACLIASRANLLLLDEPTNHLDFASLEALEDALMDFSGVIFAVSHDRRFVDRVATQVWTLHEGVLHIEHKQPA